MVETGYIEPGHGGKGRKVWIFDDGDVQRMYEAYSNKKWILLWCYTEPIHPRKGAPKLKAILPKLKSKKKFLLSIHN